LSPDDELATSIGLGLCRTDTGRFYVRRYKTFLHRNLIEIGLEHAPFVVFFPHLNMQKTS
jgi:hypothetical protein